jgi:predicted regulator of Ras-like GTPase activity (Roadblock/LC7/MglB family)
MMATDNPNRRVLGLLAGGADPDWVALVDGDGLIVSCVPPDPPISADRISAMAAASQIMAERILGELEGGPMRYASVAGSLRQHLTVMVKKDHLLSIGLGPDVAASDLAPLGRWIPEVLRVLRRFARW